MRRSRAFEWRGRGLLLYGINVFFAGLFRPVQFIQCAAPGRREARANLAIGAAKHHLPFAKNRLVSAFAHLLDLRVGDCEFWRPRVSPRLRASPRRPGAALRET